MNSLIAVKKLISALYLLVCFQVSCTHAQSIDDLIFYTDDYPPFNYADGDQLKGISIDLLLEIFKITGAQSGRKDITLLPWARGYQYALHQKNTMLFAMTRTSEREKLFHWVGPIASSNMVLLARRSDKVNIVSVADIKKYELGAVRGDIGELLLRRLLGPDIRIQLTNHGMSSARQLQKKRIDLWSYEENVAFWFIKKAGLNPGDFEVVYIIEKGNEWYVLNKETDPVIARQIQAALDQIGEDKRKEIIEKYLK